MRIEGFAPGGARPSATDNFGSYTFSITNTTDVDRLARAMVFFAGQPDVQFGRDVWVPARSTITSWALVGPPPAAGKTNGRELEILLYDRTDGTDRLVLPSTQERVRARVIAYQQREPSTTVLLDELLPPARVYGRPSSPETSAEAALRLVRVFRQESSLSEAALTVDVGMLPPTAEAFDGIDHFVVASDRLAHDPDGLRALRQWVQRGGKLWVMLDMVSPELPASLLREALDFQIVDRVSLTQFRIVPREVNPTDPPTRNQNFEQPIDFVRVVLPAGEQSDHTVDGWPAWFRRSLGRGTIVFTTLGANAWSRPRTKDDPRSSHPNFPELPVAEPPLQAVSTILQPTDREAPLSLESFRPRLTEEIGYAVASRKTVFLVFIAFLMGIVGLGVMVRRSRHPERVGWLAPIGALIASGIFVALGESSRQAAPPTVAVVQLVGAVPGVKEAEVSGLLAVYRPDPGSADIAAQHGGTFDLDMAGIEGQSRRRLQIDQDSWRWDNLALPVGVRFAPFRFTVSTPQPLVAVSRFGPDGLVGKLDSQPFTGLSDAVLRAPNGRSLLVRFNADGSFVSTNSDALASGEFLPGSVLTDRQQRRQGLYRQLASRSGFNGTEGRPVMLTWAEPVATGFDLVADARTLGEALVVVPVRLAIPQPGEVVTIPGIFTPYRRVMQGNRIRPTLESSGALNMELRFQLPAEVLPLTPQRARLFAKLNAPGRKVVVASQGTELYQANSPLDPIRVEINDPKSLHIDAEGGINLQITIANAAKGSASAGEKWTIEYLELEVTGQHR